MTHDVAVLGLGPAGRALAHRLVVAGADPSGVLYGTFALLRKISLREPVGTLDETRAQVSALVEGLSAQLGGG